VRRGAAGRRRTTCSRRSRRWPGPSVAAWVPSEFLLPSGPGCCSPRPRLPGGASCRHPAGGRRRRGRQCQDAGHGVGRRSASTMRCPPTRGRRPGSGSPARPVSSPSGVRSPGVVVRGPAVRTAGVHPSSVQLSGVHPSVSTRRCPPVRCPPVGVQPVWCPACLVSAPSVRTRPSPPTSGGGVGDQAGAAGHPSPQEPVEVLVGCRAVERLGRRPSRPGGGRRCRGRALVSGESLAAWPGWVRRPRVPAARPGRPGRRAERRWLAARVAAPAGWLPLLGWVGDHAAWSSWSLPPGWTGPGRGRRGVPADRRAAPTRPRPAAGAPGSLPAAL
jgi:hypothetical protein